MQFAPDQHAEEARPKRRCLQFHLRTLVVLVTVIAVGLAWLARPIQRARQQTNAVAAILNLGEEVEDSGR